MSFLVVEIGYGVENYHLKVTYPLRLAVNNFKPLTAVRIKNSSKSSSVCNQNARYEKYEGKVATQHLLLSAQMKGRQL